MPIHFHYDGVTTRVKHVRAIKSWIQDIIASENYTLGDINYILCSPEKICEINRQYLNHDYITDIITFDYVESNTISGDIFVCPYQIKLNAKSLKEKLENETHRVLIHGVLHLIGYKDKTHSQQSEMRSKEDYCLSLRKF